MDERTLMFDGRALAGKQVLLPIWRGLDRHNPQHIREDNDTRHPG
jgi:hypothetical protein